MRSLKRQRCYENDVDNGNSRKQLSIASTPGMELDSPCPEDDIVDNKIITGQDLDHERICYGAISDVHILMCSNTKYLRETQPWDRYVVIDIRVGAAACFLSPDPDVNTDQRSFLDEDAGVTLMFVTNKVRQVSFSAVLSINALDTKIYISEKPIVKVTVNVYGPRHMMDQVDQALSQIPANLQHPTFLEPGVSYVNPQFFYTSPEKTDLRHLVGPTCENATSPRAVNGFMECLDNLSEYHPAAKSSLSYLQSIVNRYLLKTKLKEHQLQGVEFVLEREDPNVAKQIHKKMLMYIDHRLLLHPDKPGLGGIIADMMGLGKTLTMLSAILCSKQLRLDNQRRRRGKYKGNTQRQDLTLIVLPSRQLLDVWKNEIDQRFRPQTFNIQIFHGSTRASNGDLFLNSDIVLTTYHTLEKDSSGNSMLNSIRWSRIVLDEAHHIRNPSTKMHKATISLQSTTRWCLTGTPVQSSLDDVRSLLQFLQFEPFCHSKAFDEYIMKPFRQESDDLYDACSPSRNLTVMLKACCLRRSKAKLNLPTTYTRTISVIPTDAERIMFKRVLDECRETFDKIASDRANSRKSNVLFSAIIKLRRLCNHGTIELNAPTSKPPNHPNVTKVDRHGFRTPSAEPTCEFCRTVDLENDYLGTLDSCPFCSRLLCAGNMDILSSAPSFQYLPSPMGSAMDVDSPGPSDNVVGVMSSNQNFGAQSSKMFAIINNIKESFSRNNLKSVVFSSWRDTLDILAAMLTLEGIQFVQVDGRTSLIDRTRSISTFRHNPAIQVLLITINTGAVGLTLTEANMVHIVEPQWSPTTEDQAISRIVRIGQTRPVTVFKYIMKRSIEQSVMKLQEKKTQIIKLSMQDKDNGESDEIIDRFKFTIDPNEWESGC